MRCLVVDNDVMAADGLSAVLGSDMATIDQAHSGREALDRIGRQSYDAAFVEIVLPDIDGYEVIRSIRNSGSNIPVLIVSTLSKPAAKVAGLRAGADDFITKPFDAEELRARVRAVVRRSVPASHPRAIAAGLLQLNPDSGEVIVRDRPVHFTRKEFAILEFLVQRRGCVVSTDAILSHLYSGADLPETRIIEVFICKMRRKLAQIDSKDVIKTVWGEGFTISAALN